MKKINTILILGFLALLSNFCEAQDIRFSYTITVADGESTVKFLATNTGADAENMATFAINFYYDDNETSVSTVDFSPISTGENWGTANQTITNHEALDNPSVPITHTGYFVYSNVDNNFVGKDFAAGEVFCLGTVIFDNAENIVDDGGEGFIASIVEQPNLTYADNNFFPEHDVLIIGEQQQVLPINLRTFNVSKRDEKSASIDWSTSSEINGSHFDVQRSQNLDDWTTIGKVQAIGESTTLQNYSMIDSDIPLSTRSSKTFYYRLNMVDNDGSQEYSEVRTVRFNQDGGDFIVYPNPTANDVFVNLSSITTETGPATLNVFNMNGQNVKQVTLSSNDDIRVDISNISTGAYYFIVRQGEETYSQKVIKID